MGSFPGWIPSEKGIAKAWASEYLALAVSLTLGGTAPVAVNFSAWSALSCLAGTWVANGSASEAAADTKMASRRMMTARTVSIGLEGVLTP
jgi:hypothetical protein